MTFNLKGETHLRFIPIVAVVWVIQINVEDFFVLEWRQFKVVELVLTYQISLRFEYLAQLFEEGGLHTIPVLYVPDEGGITVLCLTVPARIL